MTAVTGTPLCGEYFEAYRCCVSDTVRMGTVSVPVILPPVSLYQATSGVLRYLHRDTIIIKLILSLVWRALLLVIQMDVLT